jgi:hypothetical protein
MSSECIWPVGTMGFGDWHVATLDGQRLRLTGLLQFTDKGSALVWTDTGATSLALGLARGRWGSIVAEDGECED